MRPPDRTTSNDSFWQRSNGPISFAKPVPEDCFCPVGRTRSCFNPVGELYEQQLVFNFPGPVQQRFKLLSCISAIFVRCEGGSKNRSQTFFSLLKTCDRDFQFGDALALLLRHIDRFYASLLEA
jgi:hypothetical protein